MTRKKVKLRYIENANARKMTYKKRTKGILKKAQEINVLCDVDACVILYGPYEQAPVVWPPSEVEVRRIISEFKRKPEIDVSQRRFDQLTFLKQSVIKAEDRLKKIQRRNREIEMENLISDLLNGKPIEEVPYWDFDDILYVIGDKIRSILHRATILEGDGNNHNNNGASGNNQVGEQAPPEFMQFGASTSYHAQG